MSQNVCTLSCLFAANDTTTHTIRIIWMPLTNKTLFIASSFLFLVFYIVICCTEHAVLDITDKYH